MSLQTTWGYTLSDATAYTDMLTSTEFNTFTASKYSGDTRIASEIASACNAIRNYCGWHIYPSLACELEKTMLHGDGSIKRVGADLMIQLPATFVSAVSSVVIDDESYTDFSFDAHGLLHVFDAAYALTRKSVIELNYTAGLPDTAMDAIKELIAHRVTHALSSSYGVTSESAGGMSITYNSNWINSSRATALPDDNKEVLAPYRVRGVF